MPEVEAFSEACSEQEKVWRHGALTVPAAAAFLNISRRTIYHLIDDGLPSSKVRGRRLVSRRALIDLLQSGEG